MKKRYLFIGIASGIVTTVLVAFVTWIGLVHSGAYNVAASDPHLDVVRWTLDTKMRRSVASRAGAHGALEKPSRQQVTEGARHYPESCAHYHAAPGQEPARWSRGMRPLAPHLTEEAEEWDTGEIYWIASNGIKMTGMPAFSDGHSPEELEATVAFVDAMPGLTAQDYAELAGSTEQRSQLRSAAPLIPSPEQ